MKNEIVLSVILAALLFSPLMAVQVFDPDYMVETYFTYPHITKSGLMAFDSSGNLYIAYGILGTIDRVTPAKTVSTFVSGLTEPRNLVWTGGTTYGDNLYVADHSENTIRKIDMNGNVTNFASINSPQGVELDRIGTYGGNLFTGPRTSDHIDRILPNGTIQKFSDFPYNMPGGVCDLTFDPGTAYGGLMYVGTDSALDVDWRGVHSIDINGNPTRFAPDIVDAAQIMFDPYGIFDNKLFIGGRKDRNDPWEIWRAEPDGTNTLFGTGTISPYAGFEFGPDGAMYVHESANDMVTISRITLIPEPASVLLLGLGGLVLRRRGAYRLL